MLTKKQEEKLLYLLDEKIREADVYFREEEDTTDEEIDNYISGLKMAKDIIKEHEYLYD